MTKKEIAWALGNISPEEISRMEVLPGPGENFYGPAGDADMADRSYQRGYLLRGSLIEDPLSDNDGEDRAILLSLSRIHARVGAVLIIERGCPPGPRERGWRKFSARTLLDEDIASIERTRFLIEEEEI